MSQSLKLSVAEPSKKPITVVMDTAPNDRSFLMELPLELRHRIFELFSARGFKEKYLLRQWFERKDVEAKVAQYVADHPDEPALLVVYYAQVEPRIVGEQENAQEEVKAENGDEMDGEQDVDMVGVKQEDEDEEMEGVKEEDEDEEQEQDDDDQVDDEDEDDEEDVEEDEDDEDEDEDERHIVAPHPKWRHVPKFIQLTKMPPPAALLSINKQLHEEVRAWFCKTSALAIDVTASFCHTGFFELVLDEIASASSSVLRSITTVKVILVWDTTWLRTQSDDYIANVFPTMLTLRITKVLDILKRATSLEEVKVYWHDTVGADDLEGQSFMSQCLEGFLALPAKLDVTSDLIGPGTIPREKRLARRRRAEFHDIVDNGRDMF